MSSPTSQGRLEDTLTDGVFSALRYLPRDVLGYWLRTVLPTRVHGHLTTASLEAARFDFWPKLPGGAEPDVVLRVGSLLIIIEAKYDSPFNSFGRRHQLSAQWQQASRLATLEGLEGPVSIAITADLVAPGDIDVARQQLDRHSLAAAVLSPQDALVWCPWQSVAQAVDSVNVANWHPGQHAITTDLFELMKRRGVRYVYEGFKTADWWLLAAAADAATERVYPTVAEFAKELTQQGASRGLVWGGNDAGVVWYESKHPNKTHEWHRHYIQLPLLHKEVGRRQHNFCALYVLFSFNDPAIRAGWWFQPRKPGEFTARAGAIAAWLRDTDADLSVIDSTSWQRRPEPVDRHEVAEVWLRKRLEEGAWFRVERRWTPESLTSTAPVLDVLDKFAQSLVKDGAVLDALAADGTLDRSQAPVPLVLSLGDDVSDDNSSSGSSEASIDSSGTT